ncbi:MAG: hypothetical protein EOO39_16585 [Cytophagaceae bacterium]|nr:MAG: hypothetical protein EOO39_16585 [Cytophagaceae bacterium]
MPGLRLYGVSFLVLSILMGARLLTAPHPYTFTLPDHFPSMPVNKDNPVTKEGVFLGRSLFYDPILSRDSNTSCASCHRQEAAFSDAPNVNSTRNGHVGQIRNVMPLFNLAWYPAYFWDGRAISLETQVMHPITNPGEHDTDWDTITKRLKKNRRYTTLFRASEPACRTRMIGIQSLLSTYLSRSTRSL